VATAPTELPVELAPGLCRWMAPYPDWRPPELEGGADGWNREVGSVLFEAGETVVLFDPLLPGDGRAGFLDWLDARVAGRAVTILTTIHWHSRDREQLAARYGANSERAWNAVPPGVEPKPLRGAGETDYWLPAVAALVFGDRLIGDEDGGAQLCPEGWLHEVRVDRAGLARLMRPLIELPVERLLVSHGRPVLRDGRAILARAIRAAQQS
jgi:hypothetical protein